MASHIAVHRVDLPVRRQFLEAGQDRVPAIAGARHAGLEEVVAWDRRQELGERAAAEGEEFHDLGGGHPALRPGQAVPFTTLSVR